MTRDVVTVTPETPATKIASLLEARRIKRVPVLRGSVIVTEGAVHYWENH